MVTRLLDLVAAHFDNVVIDVPRTWFAWTDSVLIGSNRLFLVTEMTVPGLKHARHLVNVIRERLPDGPPLEVIVNRFEQRLFGPGLRRADIEQALGDSLAGTIPNNFRLVSEAIDRGVPLDEVKAGNNIATALGKLVFPPKAAKSAAKPVAGRRTQARAGALRQSCSAVSPHQSASPRPKRPPRPQPRARASPSLPPVEAPSLQAVAELPKLEPNPEPAPSISPLRDKLLDAKVRLHRRLIEEINLSAIEKVSEGEVRRQISALVAQYVLAERIALNAQELEDFVDEIIDEMTGLGPIEPLLKDPTITDILINGHECVYVERAGMLEPTPVRFKDEAHLLRIVNKIVSAVGRRVDESAAAVRRAPARRLARQHRGAADRGRRAAGVDPQILQEALQPGEAGRGRRAAPGDERGARRRGERPHHDDHLGRHRLRQDHDAQRAVGVHLRQGAPRHHRGRGRTAAAAAACRPPGDAPAQRRGQAARSASANWSRTRCACGPTASSSASAAARKPSTCCRR